MGIDISLYDHGDLTYRVQDRPLGPVLRVTRQVPSPATTDKVALFFDPPSPSALVAALLGCPAVVGSLSDDAVALCGAAFTHYTADRYDLRRNAMRVLRAQGDDEVDPLFATTSGPGPELPPVQP